MKHEWEVVATDDLYGNTMRLIVPGGWLYKHAYYSGDGSALAMVFVPVPPTATGHPAPGPVISSPARRKLTGVRP